ncbi:MAG TPA: type VI secretion system accessory protein TagJ [Candidatus Sulfotelmatobacter sp.]|nr:type VI secretion system accessory protein TagJ [Candidatus Sulfotelmatobacter sp.]
MVGTELLETGQLSTAIERVAGEVKVKPTDLTARTFYFELLCLAGDLDRAAKQLDVLAASDLEMCGRVGPYLGAIQAERERRRFFHGGPRPPVMGETPYTAAYLEAVENYAAGDFATANTLLENAVEQRRSLRGTLNGAAFEELSDTADLLAPFLEIVIDGHYTWVPWQAIQSLSIPEPKNLRDMVWSPCSLSLHSGSHGEALVFSLYVDSHLDGEDDVRLGRRTIWSADQTGFTVAYGQKMISADDVDHPLLEVRQLEVEPCP